MSLDAEVEWQGERYNWHWEPPPSSKNRGTWTTSDNIAVPQSTIADLESELVNVYIPNHVRSLDSLEKRTWNAVVQLLSGTSLRSTYSPNCDSGVYGEQSPLNNVELCEWAFEGLSHSQQKSNMTLAERITFRAAMEKLEDVKRSKSCSYSFLGAGPFETKFLEAVIEHRGGIPKSPDSSGLTDLPSCVIIGRAEWSPSELDQVIDARVGERLQVFSQEMLLWYLLTGNNPFDAGSKVLNLFKVGHPGLERVAQGWHGWVLSWVSPVWRQHSIPGTFSSDVQSPLVAMGYKVGAKGIAPSARRELLRIAFLNDLPKVGQGDDLEPWGNRGEPIRLKKIAEHIANDIRRVSGHSDKDYSAAISDWQDDLDWLRSTFYHGVHSFDWPTGESDDC